MMSEDELKKAEKKYNGNYNKWTGTLRHIAAVWSRQNISNAVMRLSGYTMQLHLHRVGKH